MNYFLFGNTDPSLYGCRVCRVCQVTTAAHSQCEVCWDWTHLSRHEDCQRICGLPPYPLSIVWAPRNPDFTLAMNFHYRGHTLTQKKLQVGKHCGVPVLLWRLTCLTQTHWQEDPTLNAHCSFILLVMLKPKVKWLCSRCWWAKDESCAEVS